MNLPGFGSVWIAKQNYNIDIISLFTSGVTHLSRWLRKKEWWPTNHCVVCYTLLPVSFNFPSFLDGKNNYAFDGVERKTLQVEIVGYYVTRCIILRFLYFF